MKESFKKGFGVFMGVVAGLIVGNEILTIYNKLTGTNEPKQETKDDSAL